MLKQTDLVLSNNISVRLELFVHIDTSDSSEFEVSFV